MSETLINENDAIEFAEKEREYVPLKRFSGEYFNALSSMNHPRHREAMLIRKQYLSKNRVVTIEGHGRTEGELEVYIIN